MQKRLRLEWGRERDTRVRGREEASLNWLTFGTVTAIGGFLFVYGGSKGQRVNSLFRFSVVEKTWVQLTSPNELPIRSMHSSTLVDDGLFIFGGYSTTATVNSAFRYDITTNTCEKLECSGDIPSPRRGHCAEFFERRNVILIFGGGNDSGKVGGLFSFSVSQREWKRLKPKGDNPTHRNRVGNVKVGSKWYLVGGATRYGFSNEVFVLDLAPSVPTWSKVACSGSPPRRMDVPVMYVDGCLVVLSSTVHVLDTRERKFEAAGAEGSDSRHVVVGVTPSLNGAFAATVNGKFYVFSGNSLYKPYYLTYGRYE